MKTQNPLRLLRPTLATLIPLAALILQWMFWPAMQPYVWFLFYPAVFFSSWVGGLPGGLVATVISTAFVWWFFIPSVRLSPLEDPRTLISVAVFMGMGVLFSISHGRLRKANQQAAEALEAARNANDLLQGANEKITKLYEKTRELDELKTQFFANVSHELRTPLALIIGPTEKLIASTKLDDDARRDLDVIVHNARLLLNHVNDLLDVSKLEAGKMGLKYGDVDMARLVRLTAVHFDLLAQERRIRFSVEADAILRGQVDPEKFQRVLLNLLSNAFKFTPEGGRIRCTLRRADMHALLEVADSGPGIPAEQREIVFERFRQLEGGATRRHGGTGLGLAIARDLVDLHGGSISISEAPEGGALFTVRLPTIAPEGSQVVALSANTPVLAEAARHASMEFRGCVVTSAALPVASGNEGRALVLVIEDNPEMNRFVRDILGGEYRTECALNGKDGLRKALELRPDLIVSDVMMPEMSGDILVREIRSRSAFNSTPLLLLTAKADDALRVRLLQEGANDYVMKPFSVEELLARVRNLVNGKLADQQNRQLNAALEERHEHLEQMTAQLKRANEELEAFSYSVSHDLRAPLRAMDGFSRILLEDYGSHLDPEARRYLDIVRGNTQQMGRLVDDLLSFSRLSRQPLRKQRVDPATLVRQVLEESQAQRDGRRLEILVSDLPPCAADPTLLKQVWVNLLDNALKFTCRRDPAVIEIGVLTHAECGVRSAEGDRERAESRVVQSEIRNPKSEIVYFVKDNGVGFDMQYAGKLFGVFQRLHRAEEYEGTGVGLAIVQRVIHRHGGRVWAEAEADKGATFYFTLPEGETHG